MPIHLEPTYPCITLSIKSDCGITGPTSTHTLHQAEHQQLHCMCPPAQEWWYKILFCIFVRLPDLSSAGQCSPGRLGARQNYVRFDGHINLIIIVCHMMGFTAIKPINDMNSSSFTKAVCTILLRYGLAGCVITDPYSKFKGGVVFYF
jgi:hypothetical protein